MYERYLSGCIHLRAQHRSPVYFNCGACWLLADRRRNHDVCADLQNFAPKNGRPTQYITGEEKHLKRWITIPHALVLVCDLVIIVGCNFCLVQHQAKTCPSRMKPCASSASNGPRSFQQAGPDGVMDYGGRYPLGRRTARQSKHDLSTLILFRATGGAQASLSPRFALSKTLCPAAPSRAGFAPIKWAPYDIQCTQMCGIWSWPDGRTNYCGDAAGPCSLAECATKSRPWLVNNRPQQLRTRT